MTIAVTAINGVPREVASCPGVADPIGAAPIPLDRTQCVDKVDRDAPASGLFHSESRFAMKTITRTVGPLGRSPAALTVITAYLHMLQELMVGPLTQTQQRYLGKIGQAVTRMLGLLGEILDLSKLEAGKLSVSPEPMDLAGTVAEAAERFKPGAVHNRGAASGHPVRVSADPGRLDRVLMNLLSKRAQVHPGGRRDAG